MPGPREKTAHSDSESERKRQKVNFDSQIANAPVVPVIRTGEMIVSDDSRHVQLPPLQRTYFFPVDSTVDSIWRVTFDSMLLFF